MSEQKIGRPQKIPGGGKRTLILRISEAQMEKIGRAAKRVDMSKSAWSRWILEMASAQA